MILTEIFGTIGALLALLAFILIQNNILKNSDSTYDLLNFLAGTILAIYALIIGSVPFLIINVAWAFFSLKDLLQK